MSKFIKIGNIVINKKHITLITEGIYDDDDKHDGKEGRFVVISLLGKTSENFVVDKKGVYAQSLSGHYWIHQLEIKMDKFIAWFYGELEDAQFFPNEFPLT